MDDRKKTPVLLLTADGVNAPVNWFFRFFLIWVGQAFSLFGTSLISFALIWWLTEKTGATSVLAAGTFFAVLPRIVLGPFAGTFVDRISRKTIMVITNTANALLTAFLTAMFLSNIIQPWLIILVMSLREVCGTFQYQAMTATTTLMVPETQLSRIGGMNQTLSGILGIVAPPAGALLITAFPIHMVLPLDIITCITAIIPLLIITIPSPSKKAEIQESSAEKSSFVQETKEGVQFVLAWKALFWVVMTCTFANIFTGPCSSFMPLLVTRVFNGGALELSYISIASGIGVIAGGLLMSAWKGFSRRLITAAVGWLGVGIAYSTASLTPANAYPMFLAMMFITGFMNPVGSAPQGAFYQAGIPADKQGRVLGVLGSIEGGTVPLGLVIAWIFGEIVPLRAWYLIVGLSHAVLGIVWLGIPFIRRAEDELSQRRERQPVTQQA